MRTLQLLALALLATAVRADIQPCQLTFLGSGVVCTEGILTFSLSSNAPPDTIVQPIPGGLALIGQMDGSSVGATSMALTVTVPKYWAIVGAPTVTEMADVVATSPDGEFGIESLLYGLTETGDITQWQTDSINADVISSPCVDCVTPFSLFQLVDDPPSFYPASTATLSTQTAAFSEGGIATVHLLEIGGFDAVSPEPSAFVLLATVVIALGCWRRWGTTVSTTRTMHASRVLGDAPGRTLES
jgi:hypothetical protein